MSGVHEVVYMDNIEALKSALRRGVDVNARNKQNATALMYAGWRGHETCARLLIEHGADINAHDETGDTALSFAITRGHAGMVRLLLECGADLQQKRENGQTVLDWAITTGHSEKMVQILQEELEKRKEAQQAFVAGKQQQLNDLARKSKKPGGLPWRI